MSLIYMQGFDTMRNDSDARAQGLLAPAGFDTIAVQFEGYTSKAGTFNSSTRLGIISGSVEVYTSTIVSTTSTPTYVNQVVQNDPNGSVKWTPTSVQGIKFTASKL